MQAPNTKFLTRMGEIIFRVAFTLFITWLLIQQSRSQQEALVRIGMMFVSSLCIRLLRIQIFSKNAVIRLILYILSSVFAISSALFPVDYTSMPATILIGLAIYLLLETNKCILCITVSAIVIAISVSIALIRVVSYPDEPIQAAIANAVVAILIIIACIQLRRKNRVSC